METFECRIDNFFEDGSASTRTIKAETRSKARYKYWMELSDVLKSYSCCFKFIKVRKIAPTTNPAEQLELMYKINSMYSVGNKIKVKQDSGEVLEWTVKYSCTMLGDHTAVIWCDEHVGCYMADRVVFEL